MQRKHILIFLILLFCIVVSVEIGYIESQYYQDGVRLTSARPNYQGDVKKLIKYRYKQKLINYPSGYSINVPTDMNFDFRYSPAFVRATNQHLDIKISREDCPYPPGFMESPYDPDSGMEMYFRKYLNRFILNPEYQKANSINILSNKWQNINGYRCQIISFTRTPASGSQVEQNSYVFAYIVTGKQEFYNLFFRTDSLPDQDKTIYGILNAFRKIPIQGINKYNLQFEPGQAQWNEETQAFYDKLKNTPDVMWGYFYPWALTRNYEKVAAVEKKLDYNFPILLHYLYIDDDFPSVGMQQAYQRKQTVELTMQVVTDIIDDNPSHNANFDLIDGKYDEYIRQFARDAKEFGHPFLFRLNNEMNTDWCQYSGVMLLSDTDIYKEVWQHIYRLFREEGVDNAIWIFNPNGGTFPPTNWNSQASYYPGNEYVQLLGLTGYNTGNYFEEVTGERWHSFDEIYAPMAEEYRKLYSKFPWIITEFASSSVGGDKEKWIKDMFNNLPKYPEIKAAVWWSYFDPDYREGKTKIPARRYWLDEKQSYLRAFKAGIHR